MFKAGNVVFPESSVLYVDFHRIGELSCEVILLDGTPVTVQGIEALELAMEMKPSVLEDKRLRHAKLAWFIHNMIGHPVMQILALVGCVKLGLRVHDATVPKPKGVKS